MIDNLHRKIGQLQVERDFLAGQPTIARHCPPVERFRLSDMCGQTLALYDELSRIETV